MLRVINICLKRNYRMYKKCFLLTFNPGIFDDFVSDDILQHPIYHRFGYKFMIVYSASYYNLCKCLVNTITKIVSRHLQQSNFQCTF